MITGLTVQLLNQLFECPVELILHESNDHGSNTWMKFSVSLQ